MQVHRSGQNFQDHGDRWNDRSGNAVETCSILTTTPNAVTSAVHDRMPVILDPDSYDLWLDPGITNMSAVSELLTHFRRKVMASAGERQSRSKRFFRREWVNT